MYTQKNPVWLTSVSGPANQSTEDAETLNLLWKPNLEIYGLQVVLCFYSSDILQFWFLQNLTIFALLNVGCHFVKRSMKCANCPQ